MRIHLPLPVLSMPTVPYPAAASASSTAWGAAPASMSAAAALTTSGASVLLPVLDPVRVKNRAGAGPNWIDPYVAASRIAWPGIWKRVAVVVLFAVDLVGLAGTHDLSISDFGDPDRDSLLDQRRRPSSKVLKSRFDVVDPHANREIVGLEFHGRSRREEGWPKTVLLPPPGTALDTKPLRRAGTAIVSAAGIAESQCSAA